ncbi:PDZ domain-containing protein [Pedococcus dokdonensis]|uniref:endopeptidase La n=1 Tax=Pedococcus dokdonensis TaxID=443156 RepID=A0A1H0L2F0_9MICO|nr:PDZ domain-containing protein [Pedococcus dokdonensis]SDO62388.1 PDZ domain-containing protein [Pedococcus dokdonensis]
MSTAPQTPGTSPSSGPLLTDPHQLSRRSVASLIGFFVAIALGALSVMVGLPYVIMKPGPITNTLGTLSGKQLITVSGAKTYPTQGALDFTTVRIAGGPGYRVTVWDLLTAAIRPSEDVVDEELYFPKGITGKQVEEESTAEMVDSQQEAIAVALKAVGQKVTEHVVVAQVAKDAPSASLIKAGDEIVSVDGKAIADSAGVRDGVGAHKPGETVALGLVRDGKPVTVRATTRESDGRATVGVFLGIRFEFPVDVKINAGDVGGPSAGTMFSLAVYDTLTPGALTGGQQIAGTGTMSSEGKVGPIGGIRQKLVGAHDGGARWFLAPAENCDEVVDHVPDGLRVVRIATFDEARTAVEAIAAKRADSLPTCTK